MNQSVRTSSYQVAEDYNFVMEIKIANKNIIQHNMRTSDKSKALLDAVAFIELLKKAKSNERFLWRVPGLKEEWTVESNFVSVYTDEKNGTTNKNSWTQRLINLFFM